MDWKKEASRDFIALGSLVLYLILIIRSIIVQYAPFVYQLLFAIVFLTILSKTVKTNQNIARALILIIFTSLFYGEILYTVFVSALWLLMIPALKYNKVPNKEIMMGIAFGIISSAVSFYLTNLIAL